MITADARAYIAHTHMLKQLDRLHACQAQRMWSLLDNDFDTGVFNHDTSEAERITDQLPTVEHLEAWTDLHRRLGYTSGLGHEDIEYMCRVRCDLGDAIDAVTRASFDEAVAHSHAAAERMHWLAHERKREGSRPARWAGTGHRQRFAELATELADIAATIRTARRAAS
jgi:hypothetical protein